MTAKRQNKPKHDMPRHDTSRQIQDKANTKGSDKQPQDNNKAKTLASNDNAKSCHVKSRQDKIIYGNGNAKDKTLQKTSERQVKASQRWIKTSQNM